MGWPCQQRRRRPSSVYNCRWGRGGRRRDSARSAAVFFFRRKGPILAVRSLPVIILDRRVGGRCVCIFIFLHPPSFFSFLSVRSRNILRILQSMSLRFLVHEFLRKCPSTQAANGAPPASLFPAVATAEVFVVSQAAAFASISRVRKRAKTNNQLRCRKPPF